MNAVCPACKGVLTLNADALHCAAGHVYPVVAGIPTLLVDTTAVAAEFEALYRSQAEPWQYSRRGAEVMKYDFIAAQAQRLLGDVRGKAIVDVGCSVGGVTAALGALGADLFSFDVSPTAVLRARQRFPAATFCVASSTLLPLPDRSADLVVLSDGIKSWQLTPEQDAACMRATAAVLKPGAPALFLDHMSPKYAPTFLRRVAGEHLQIDEVLYLGDRLFYTLERVARDLRLPQGPFASLGFTRFLKSLSQLGGRHGAKHVCVIARARG